MSVFEDLNANDLDSRRARSPTGISSQPDDSPVKCEEESLSRTDIANALAVMTHRFRVSGLFYLRSQLASSSVSMWPVREQWSSVAAESLESGCAVALGEAQDASRDDLFFLLRPAVSQSDPWFSEGARPLPDTWEFVYPGEQCDIFRHQTEHAFHSVLRAMFHLKRHALESTTKDVRSFGRPSDLRLPLPDDAGLVFAAAELAGIDQHVLSSARRRCVAAFDDNQIGSLLGLTSQNRNSAEDDCHLLVASRRHSSRKPVVIIPSFQ